VRHIFRPGTIFSTLLANELPKLASVKSTIGMAPSSYCGSGVCGNRHGYIGVGDRLGNTPDVMRMSLDCIRLAWQVDGGRRGVGALATALAALSEPKYLIRCTGSPRAACRFLLTLMQSRITWAYAFRVSLSSSTMRRCSKLSVFSFGKVGSCQQEVKR
jgi:hypothetical protein